MFDAYREHQDYVMGEATEHQNAFALSCMDRKPYDKGKIAELVKSGRFVLVFWHVEFCRFTDAVLPGHAQHYVSDHATRDEAEAARKAAYEQEDVDDDGESGYFVYPRQEYQPVQPQSERGEIPF